MVKINDMKHYLLDGKNIKEVSFRRWINDFGKIDRRIKFTKLSKNVDISTVFLGIDHGFDDDKTVLFETMIFGGDRDGECIRYSTVDNSLDGHDKVVKEFLEKGFKIIAEDVKFKKEKFTKFTRFEIMDI